MPEIPDQPKCCDMHGRNCEPPSELCCQDCTEVAHDTFPIRHADGSACSAPDQSALGFEAMLGDPHGQFDQRGELLRSVVEYANATPDAASGDSERSGLTAILLSLADIEMIKESAYRAGREGAARDIGVVAEAAGWGEVWAQCVSIARGVSDAPTQAAEVDQPRTLLPGEVQDDREAQR